MGSITSISLHMLQFNPLIMDVCIIASYRPISNLSVVSKLLERLVSRQLLDYLNKSGLLFQLIVLIVLIGCDHPRFFPIDPSVMEL